MSEQTLAGPRPTNNDNVQILSDLYAAFNRGDIPAVLDLMTPESVLAYEATNVPWGGNYTGPEGWGRFFQTVAQHLDNPTVKMELFCADGDKVVFAGRYTAQVRSTGKRIDSPLLHLWTLRNGKVIHCLEATNSAAELTALS